MNKARISYLHQEYLNQTITSEEWAELKEVLNNREADHMLSELFDANWEKIAMKDMAALPAGKFESIFDRIVRLQQPRPKTLKLRRRFAIAATIGLIICTGLFYYNRRHSTHGVQYTQDIGPGQFGATLTLSNGKKIKLGPTTAGRLATETGIVISKFADGELVYQPNPNDNTAPGHSNTLVTDRAERIKVILPDQSQVWLNAGSSLSYPTSFAGMEKRTVELNGEAYFEVQKDKVHPFVVKTNRQSVEVLGTHFDVNAYENEPLIKTTLIEGVVRITPAIKKNTAATIDLSPVTLHPKQESILTDGKVQVTDADTEEALAWMKGKFVFRDESLTSIMRRVALWYNIEVHYKDDVSDLTYWGSVSRTTTISSVLEYFSKTGNVRFKIEGRIVTVMKNNK